MTESPVMTDDTITSVGRIFFAVGVAGIGVQHFVFSDFIPVMVAWCPSWIPLRELWVYLVGALLVASGVLMVFGKWKRSAASLSGLVFLAFLLFLHIPHNIISGVSGIGGCTVAFKEFAFSGSAFVVAGSIPRSESDRASGFSGVEEFFVSVSKYPLAIMVAVFGADHFIYTSYIRTLVPSWIPGNVFWTYFAGIALIAAGVGIIINVKARLAATLLGAMLLTWVIILHIPRALADPYGRLGNEWTSAFEALAFSGVAFIMGKELPKGEG